MICITKCEKKIVHRLGGHGPLWPPWIRHCCGAAAAVDACGAAADFDDRNTDFLVPQIVPFTIIFRPLIDFRSTSASVSVFCLHFKQYMIITIYINKYNLINSLLIICFKLISLSCFYHLRTFWRTYLKLCIHMHSCSRDRWHWRII